MQNVKASDLMSTPVISVTPGTLLTEAIDRLLHWHISAMPVVDEHGKLVGIIGEHDIMNFALSGQAADTTVGEAMTENAVTYPPETPVETLVNLCASRRIRMIPITAGDKVVGVVSRRDILREMKRMYGRF